MLVYRDGEERVHTRAVLHRVHALAVEACRHAEREAARELLIEFCTLEAALLDAQCPQADRETPLTRLLAPLAVAIAAMFRARLLGQPFDATELLRRWGTIESLPLPSTVSLRVPEGFAYYALYPEDYLTAAGAAFDAMRPQQALCIGLRSIGTGLSALAAVELAARGCAVERITLRPHGHPFDRRPRLIPALAHALAGNSRRLHLIVDEGPGISGSSLCGTADLLVGLGIAEHDIVFLPSWNPDPTRLQCTTARDRWERHRRFAAPGGLPDLGRRRALRSLGAGRWRELFPWRGHAPPVQPQHERVKLREAGNSRVWRFAGFGHHGRERMSRATRLWEAHLGAKPCGFRDGLLALEWLRGTPVFCVDRALIEALARHTAFVARSFQTGTGADIESLATMIERNSPGGAGAHMGLRPHWPHESPAVWVDGRHLLHEWIMTAKGPVKVDALDHGNDHFFPGPTDIAWDLAGACVEWGLGAAERAAVCERYIGLSGDRTIATRLPFYRLAYLAFRIGYTQLAANSPEGQRFLALSRRYHRLLALELQHT